MFIDFRERKDRERERPIGCLLNPPTGDGPHNMLVYGMMLQPTKPFDQGQWLAFLLFVRLF